MTKTVNLSYLENIAKLARALNRHSLRVAKLTRALNRHSLQAAKLTRTFNISSLALTKAAQMHSIPKLPVFPSLEFLTLAQKAVQMHSIPKLQVIESLALTEAVQIPRIPNCDSLTQDVRSTQSCHALTQAKQLRCFATFICTYGIADGAGPVIHALKRRGEVVYTTWEEFSEVEINIQMSWYE